MDLEKLIVQQVRKQLYNKNYQDKLKQKQQDAPLKKLGRPPQIEINKQILDGFVPKPKGRPMKQTFIEVQVQPRAPSKKPATVQIKSHIDEKVKSGAGCSGGGCSGGSKNNKGSKLTGGSRPNPLGC